jgi:Zn-dependent peptidase ImmA (M78 family)
MSNSTISDTMPLRALIKRELNALPVSLSSIADTLGIGIRYQNLDQQTSGMIACDKITGDCVITVNNTHPTTRQRFTMAHEIAHFVLHRDIIGNGVTDNASYRKEGDYGLAQKYESEANNFAAEIIMPEELVKDYWNKNPNISEFAEAFLVSKNAAKIRLKYLGYNFD